VCLDDDNNSADLLNKKYQNLQVSYDITCLPSFLPVKQKCMFNTSGPHVEISEL